jgi:hypothetical protein
LPTSSRSIRDQGHHRLRERHGQPQEVINAEKVFYNLDSRQARFEEAAGMIEPSVFYRAAAIEETNRQTLSLTKASLTTCTQPAPRWQFSCSKATTKGRRIPLEHPLTVRVRLHWPYSAKARPRACVVPGAQVGYSGSRVR